MNCLAHIVKYILYVFNVIFVICGILLIVLGSVMIKHIGDFSSFKDIIDPNTIPILIILLGCVVFIVAFFGCCGAIRESVCCTTTYALLMFILLVLQVALIIWVFLKRHDFLNITGQAVDAAWKNNDSANGFPMNALQMAFDCCGRISYRDYLDDTKDVPSTCCGVLDGPCPESIYMAKPGCRANFVDFWASNTNIIRYAGIAVALIELVAFIFATCLASNIRKSSHRM